MIRRITTSDVSERMPLEGEPLSAGEIERLVRWINEGARWTGRLRSPAHWSYVKPTRPALPTICKRDWPRNAIDYFVLARLEAEGRGPAPEADRARLLRRVHLDLVGLPPRVDEIDRFLADDSPGAYEKVVDRLLASPRYGEKWGRQWLDLARYADSNGYQADQLREIWPYRDWVIRTMNADMPFDRFTIEQIAGDLLVDAGIDQRIATGFNRTPICNVEAGVDPEENRVQQVFDRVSTTGTVWLGATLECAQCHDHKYDPIKQRDFYRLFAFFNNTPLEVTNGGKGVSYDFYGPKIELEQPDEQANERERLASRLKRLRKDFESGIEAAIDELTAAGDSLPGELEAAVSTSSDGRTQAQKKQLRAHVLESNATLKSQQQELDAVQEQLDALAPPTTLVMVELDQPRDTRIMLRGDFLNPGDAVEPGIPALWHPFPDEAPANRLGLARWLVDPDNPLVGRVTVNRWWAEFFGSALVRTPEDFGLQGERPTHPQLLDWLAVEFVENGWSRKHIHRLIVTSSTYRQSSRVTQELLKRDPDNRLLGRGPRHRLGAEVIRDTALAIAGLLSTPMGGPPVYPPQPPGIWNHTGRNAPKYVVAADDERFRRGVYVVWRRAAPYPSFVNFDAPDRTTCVVGRARTNTPLQALTLLNDVAYLEAAKALAARCLDTPSDLDDRRRLAYAFRRCVARVPNDDELTLLEGFLGAAQDRFAVDEARAQSVIGDFTPPAPIARPQDVREWASWFYVANLLLNLDETITKE